jgi:hypothetical protein
LDDLAGAVEGLAEAVGSSGDISNAIYTLAPFFERSRRDFPNEAWALLADSTIISDLIFCIDPSLDLEALPAALRCLAFLLHDNHAACEGFIESGGTALVIAHASFPRNLQVLHHSFHVLEAHLFWRFVDPIAQHIEFFETFMGGLRTTDDPNFTTERLKFLTWMTQIYPQKASLICELCRSFFDSTANDTSDTSIVPRGLLLDVFYGCLAEHIDAIFSSGILHSLFLSLEHLELDHQKVALEILELSFSIPNPQHPALVEVARESFDIDGIVAVLTTGEPKLQKKAVTVLHLVFECLPELIWAAAESDLIPILVDLLVGAQFNVRIKVLQLVTFVIQSTVGDVERMTFLTDEFAEMIINFLEGDNLDLKNVATVAGCALMRGAPAEHPLVVALGEAMDTEWMPFVALDPVPEVSE